MLLTPRPSGFQTLLLLLALLLEPAPGCAWYKHIASRRYHTVGRASGLLMGVRRSPYMWRRQEGEGDPALTLGWDQHQQESPGGSQSEGGEGDPEEAGQHMQSPYTMPGRAMQASNSQPSRVQSDMGRTTQALTARGVREKAVSFRGVQTPQRYILASYDKSNPGEIGRVMQGPLHQSAAEPGRSIQAPLRKRTPEGTGMQNNMEVPYHKLTIQEPVMDKGVETYEPYILALHSKRTPEETGIGTPKKYVLSPYARRTPEYPGMGSIMETPYHKRPRREAGMDRIEEASKQYIWALDGKRTPEEAGMDSDMIPPFAQWIPDELGRGRNGPIIEQTHQEQIRYKLAPYVNWAPYMGMASGMQTLDGTGEDRYLSSASAKESQEGTGMNKQALYPTHKRSQEATGTYANPRGA